MTLVPDHILSMIINTGIIKRFAIKNRYVYNSPIPFHLIQKRRHISSGFPSGQMWQSGCWVEVQQGDNDADRTHDLWLGGTRPHRKPQPFNGRAGTVWGWNGHAAQSHRWTQQEDGLLEATEVILVRQSQDFIGTLLLMLLLRWLFFKKSFILFYHYLLLLRETEDLRSLGSPRPLVPDLLSHRVARSVPEISTASPVMAKPPLSRGIKVYQKTFICY